MGFVHYDTDEERQEKAKIDEGELKQAIIKIFENKDIQEIAKQSLRNKKYFIELTCLAKSNPQQKCASSRKQATCKKTKKNQKWKHQRTHLPHCFLQKLP